MTHVPASSHGSTFTGGTLTSPLTVDLSADGATASVLTLKPGSQTFPDVLAAYDLNGVLQTRIDNNGRINTEVAMESDLNAYFTNTVNAGFAPLQVGISGTSLVFEIAATGVALAHLGIATQVITSGALPTVAPVSGTAFQCSTSRDVFLTIPVTYNPGVATTATCKVELSPDNVTFSTLLTVTQPVGTVFDGSIEAVQLVVPAAWRVKLTVVNATLGTGTYY